MVIKKAPEPPPIRQPGVHLRPIHYTWIFAICSPQVAFAGAREEEMSGSSSDAAKPPIELRLTVGGPEELSLLGFVQLVCELCAQPPIQQQRRLPASTSCAQSCLRSVQAQSLDSRVFGTRAARIQMILNNSETGLIEGPGHGGGHFECAFSGTAALCKMTRLQN